MKINSGFRSLQKGVPLHDTSPSQQVQSKNFADVMQQHRENASREQLQKMLEEIQKQAERLKNSMTVRELHRYKRMVKQFLEETVKKGIGIKHARGWDRRGRTRRYKLIEEIDQHLLEMTEEMLRSEQGRMELLDRVGEVKGLLVNLVY